MRHKPDHNEQVSMCVTVLIMCTVSHLSH